MNVVLRAAAFAAACSMTALQAQTASPAPDSKAAFAGTAAVAGNRLAHQRGGTVTTRVEQNGQLSDATARNVVTGANSVRDGSFANAAGLSTVIQNSGANVLIQNSMTVNVQLK